MNEVINTMLNRKSIRKYEDRQPSEEVLRSVVRAGQQAPFASQLCSLLLSRKKGNPFHAPLLFTICVDLHRMELIMKKRGWSTATNDLSLLFFGIQDAAYMAENMVIAAESLGMGSCFLGGTPYSAEKIIKKYNLPKRVFPLVQLTMGYPAEDAPPRPRYPMDFTLFEDRYPEMDEKMVENAMEVMDKGYLEQDYYKKAGAKISMENGKQDEYTYKNYSWTEHISRKWGQWLTTPDELLDQLEKCGFNVRYGEEAHR